MSESSAAVSNESTQRVIRQASRLIKGLSGQDLGQVLHYVQGSGQAHLKDLETILEGFGFVRIGKIDSQKGSPQQEPRDTWQGKQHVARMHKPHKDEFTGVEVRFLPSVRKYVDYLAAAKGMAAAECIESVMVDTINQNPELIEQGEKRLKQFGGNLTRAKRDATQEKLARLEALESRVPARSR